MSKLIESKLAAMESEQWKVTVRDRPVIIKRQIDRVVKGLIVAKDFIAAVGNTDPVHIGLPCAGVCLLLQVIPRHPRHTLE